MLFLSQKDIEVIGYSILRDYEKRGDGNIQIPVHIESFARNYLGLNIEYQKLSETGKILGLTSYKGVILELAFDGGSIHLNVPENTILLDERLKRASSLHRRRFTVAHECAHQILARIEESVTAKNNKQIPYSCREVSFRVLQTTEDWTEWQANALGAVLLLPKHELVIELNRGFTPFKPTIYGNRLNSTDYAKAKAIADKFCVSMAAMKIRLKELDSIIT